MVNLTVDEAVDRAASLRTQRYDVTLDLDTGDTTFESTSRIAFESLDGSPTFFEVAPETLRRVDLDGQPLDVDRHAAGRFPLELSAGPHVLTVYATMAYSHDGEGLHRTVDPEDGQTYVYAMTFLDAAPRVFACFDQPDLKAVFNLRVRTPAAWTVVGNGRATAEPAELDESGEPLPARWWSLRETRPISTYLVTLVTGPYHSVTREHDGITMGLHCRQSLASHLDKDADELFTLTGQCFDEYHRLFGIRYPFGDYHQAFVPEFNAGAMENPGCVTFADEMVFRAQATQAQRSDRANVVAHEMAHQWFGDLVTMRWWDDLWLNESFADFMGHQVCVDATAFTDLWLLFALNNKAWGLDADQRTSTHPVAGNGAPDAHSALTNFDGISYSKGCVALRQLSSYLGAEAFRAGIVDHLTTHSYGNATLADLVESWERASGRDLTDWTHGWLGTSGVDTLTVQQGAITTVGRVNGSPEDVPRIHAIQVSSYDASGTATTVPALLTEPSTELPLDSSAGDALVLADSQDESWAKVRLDPGAVDRLPVVLPRIADPVSRAVVWGALRDGLLDAQVSPDAYVDTVVAALPHETDDLVLGRVLAESAARLGTFLHTADQHRRLADLTRDLVLQAQPATNRQLVVSRVRVRLSDDIDELWSWLDGHAPEGLQVDPDLRWRLLEQLCVLGSAGRDELARELAADPSSQGALAALRCSAALPTVDGKAATWDRIIGDADISNHDLYALCESFFRPSQETLNRPYYARYFTELPATVGLRNGWVLQLSCMKAYPQYAASDDILALAGSVLDRDDLDHFVRRAISDGTDDLRRLRASRVVFG